MGLISLPTLSIIPDNQNSVGMKPGEIVLVKASSNTGKSVFEAACFYCPYIPLQFTGNIETNPTIFKTRYTRKI